MATSDASRLEDGDWQNILKIMKKGKCTYFIGARSCAVHCPCRDIGINGPRMIIILKYL